MSAFFDRHPRWSLCTRLAAAVIGGYGVASAWVVLWGAMQSTRVQSILGGMQTSWILYVGAVIWAFSPVPLGRVWRGLLLSTAFLLGAAALAAHWG